MKMRQIVGVAVFLGALGALGGQPANAQGGNPARFVRLLLLRESNLIFQDRQAISRQNRQERTVTLLETRRSTPRVGRLITQLERGIVQLQRTIDRVTLNLVGLNTQVQTVLPRIPTPNPFTRPAASNAAIIAALAARPPFGIPPATLTQ